MTENVLQVGQEIMWILGGAAILILFAVTVSLPHRSGVMPGSSGHREDADEVGHEVIRADGYIDSFGGEISEAGGGLPLVVLLAIPGVLGWWLIYLILNWTPR